MEIPRSFAKSGRAECQRRGAEALRSSVLKPTAGLLVPVVTDEIGSQSRRGCQTQVEMSAPLPSRNVRFSRYLVRAVIAVANERQSCSFARMVT